MSCSEEESLHEPYGSEGFGRGVPRASQRAKTAQRPRLPNAFGVRGLMRSSGGRYRAYEGATIGNYTLIRAGTEARGQSPHDIVQGVSRVHKSYFRSHKILLLEDATLFPIH